MSYITASFDDKVISLLKSGAVGFMPSDTIYGLSCLALNEEAVERLRLIKKRNDSKRMIVLISKLDQLDGLYVDKEQAGPVKNYWPGSVTLICSAPKAPAWLNRGEGEFGIRFTGDTSLRKLIDAVGPLISTSANLPAGTPAQSAAEAQRIFGDQLDFYVDAGKLNGQASTIVKVENSKLQVLRQGAVTIDEKELYESK